MVSRPRACCGSPQRSTSYNTLTIHGQMALSRGAQPDYDPVLAYPSFLKKLDVSATLEIWQQADAALRQGDEVEVWGYSLPESDSAMRVTAERRIDRPINDEEEHKAWYRSEISPVRTKVPTVEAGHKD